MKSHCIIERKLSLFFTVVLLAVNATAQQEPQQRDYIVAPSDIYLLSVASQPSCPIQVEGAELLFAVGPGSNWGVRYRLRNVGSAPLRVRSITFSMWTAQGIGLTLQELVQEPDKPIPPGQLVTVRQDRPIKIVPLDDEIKDRMKLRGKLKAIVVLVVDKIQFSDGSIYADEQRSKALQAYFENVELADGARYKR